MIRRLVVAMVVVVVAIAPRPADAADSRSRFTACAAVSATAPRCYRGGVTYEVGRTVFLRGRVMPAQPGFGDVVRRAPHGNLFVPVGTMGIGTDGRIRWSWTPRRRDIDRAEPYLFAFRVQGVGRSPAVEVWVVPEDYWAGQRCCTSQAGAFERRIRSGALPGP
jgi:hypothetical protein